MTYILYIIIYRFQHFSGIGHTASPDIEKLPDAVPKERFKPVVLQSGQPTFISFDLETTDLSKYTKKKFFACISHALGVFILLSWRC